jgi:DNA-binding transcriptional MerR regulator/Flp pilus assembly protein TadD
VGRSDKNERLLDGRRVVLVGKLSGMSRREAEQLIRNHGGLVASQVDGKTELVVVGDESPDGRAVAAAQALLDDASRLAWQEGSLEVLGESELWSRLGLVDAGPDVSRLYTPVMLAELVRVSARAVRHWHRKGHLDAERHVGRLPYFNFEQVRVARRLAELLSAGCSLSQIDRKLDELARLRPDARVPLADASVVVVGRRLYVRRGDQLTEPSGQLLIDFDTAQDATTDSAQDTAVVAIPISSRGSATASGATAPGAAESFAVESFAVDDLRSLADDFEQDGEVDRAIEVYRSILMSGDFTAEDHFSLAELLYRCGDLAAARERYYAAIELDENYVEARANLGCLLVEQEEHALAEAAFRGALEYHPDFADAHFHLARLLDATSQTDEASRHWQRFLDLAPASPWAEEALDRTGAKAHP